MEYAVQECYYSVEKILHSLVDGEGRLWYESLRKLQELISLSCEVLHFSIGSCLNPFFFLKAGIGSYLLFAS